MPFLQHFWIVNAALTVALGVVSARALAGAIDRGLDDPLRTPPAVARQALTSGAQPGAPRQYGAIVERNLFNSKDPGGVVDAPKVTAGRSTAAVEAPLPPLNARLIGTVIGEEGEFAIIEDETTRRQDLYRLNETVVRDARLVRIERDRVRLKRGNRVDVLEIAFLEPRAPGPQAAPVAATPPQPDTGVAASGVAQSGENRFVVDQRELNAAFDNMNQLLTQARMVPYFNAGRADGFRIFAIRPNSLFEKIGLRDGDVLQRVNGNDISDPGRAFELFEQLRNEKQVTVDLVRNNVKQTLSYEIR